MIVRASPIRLMAACVACAATLLLAAPAAARFDPARISVESPAVAARFPDPIVDYETPGFRAGREDFTSHAELMAYIEALQARRGGFALRIIGTSKEGRAIPLLAFTAPSAATPEAIRRGGKPTVLIVAQQHGNEPAGSEAALVIATRLAGGDLKALLDRINVLIVPRANPDGAESFVRDTSARIDMNRDHLLLRTGEARAIALVAREYQPDVVIDAHEFTVMDRWVDKFGGVMSYDALLQYATVGNLPPALTKAADARFRTAILGALEGAQLKPHWYFTTEAGSSDKTVSMGGVQPDTWRNVGGLRNAVSFLLETRGVGIGRAHFKRRVRTHELTMAALLLTTAAFPADTLALTRGAAAGVAASACSGDYVVESDATRTTHALTFLDPATGSDREVDVPWRSALDIRTLRTRPRPCGYFLDGAQREAAARLRDLGVVIEQLDAPLAVRAERYRVVGSEAARRADGRGAIDDPEGVLRVTVETELVEATLPAGTFYISLAQPLANLVAAALEPDSQNSFVANRLFPLDGGQTLLRAKSQPAAKLSAWKDR
ncbi:MAG: M14 family zinc carboxypeptidase [Casimicrobiaceae bacterium]